MPRALKKQGLPGIGQTLWPESAREIGRRAALVESEIDILEYSPVDEGGGAYLDEWSFRETIRGRIQPVSSGADPTARGEQLEEQLVHRVYFDEDVAISSDDRLRIQDTVFTITNESVVSDALVSRVDVKRA